MWADTGQIAGINWAGSYDFPTSDSTLSTSDSSATAIVSSQAFTENGASPLTGVFAVMGTVSAITSAVAIASFVARKRRSK